MTFQLLERAAIEAYTRAQMRRLELVGAAHAWRIFKDRAHDKPTPQNKLSAVVADGILRKHCIETERAEERWARLNKAADKRRYDDRLVEP